MEIKKATYYSNNGEFEADKLLPCPFCGNNPELTFVGNDNTKSRKVTIKCKHCRTQRTDAAIQNNHEWITKESIKLWNNRRVDNKQLLTFVNEIMSNKEYHSLENIDIVKKYIAKSK